MSSVKPLTTPKKTSKTAKTPKILAKTAKKLTKPVGNCPVQTEENQTYYAANAARIKSSATARYNAYTKAERRELRWRREARPPTPQPGSRRSLNGRAVALANAYCDFSDIEEVVRTYIACAVMNELGMGVYHCDHTVPISSRLVCGLHTHTNIRVVSVHENRIKGNTFWPQMWPMDWSTLDLLRASP